MTVTVEARIEPGLEGGEDDDDKKEYNYRIEVTSKFQDKCCKVEVRIMGPGIPDSSKRKFRSHVPIKLRNLDQLACWAMFQTTEVI